MATKNFMKQGKKMLVTNIFCFTIFLSFNSLPKDKILDWSKFKAFADAQINMNQRTEGPESCTDGETLIFWDR